MDNSGSRFVWYELATTDMNAAQAFYASVLGWSMADASMSGSAYSLFTAGGTPVAGLTTLPAEAIGNGAMPQWIGYVSVDDVDAVTARVKPLGGTVHVPPTDVPNVSRFSMVADPQLAPFALIKGRQSGGERPAPRGMPGHVGWYDLLTGDVEKAFAFYSELLGWRRDRAEAGPMGTYQEFLAGTERVGGMFPRPDMSPFFLWLYYFNITGIEAAAKRVLAGGGKVLYGPVAVPGGARVVHCADPQGAMFALIDLRIRIAVGCYSARD